MASKIFAVAALAAVAHGHTIMQKPVPFDVPNLNSSPLDESGSDFPCKGINYGNVIEMNKFDVGGKGQLAFMGSAVHGGGSCQVSVTYDNPPTKDSVWKVIHSIEGGCITRDQDGNYPEDPNYPNPNTYDFTMPAIPDGEAILAWTWFNKVGNREMYMNCAPITISGTGSADTYNGLPDMMVANIGNGCTTTAYIDVEFPNPGDSVERNDKGTYGPPEGNCGTAAPTTPKEPETPSEQPVPSATKPATTSPSAPGGVFMPDPAQSSAPAAAKPTSTTPTTPETGSGSGALTGACTEEGAFNCIGGSAFQQCGSGKWSDPTTLSTGTTCKTGPPSMAFTIEAA